jgi:hypothetical protein
MSYDVVIDAGIANVMEVSERLSPLWRSAADMMHLDFMAITPTVWGLDHRVGYPRPL